ncbi:hypothetical protein ACIQVO_36940 [Streptomyces sp. NPDC101062]|uniref:hypothetical protein n=1 Tax=unclassified Streptomyces TaxID=2593676 RepID=UPI00383062A0
MLTAAVGTPLCRIAWAKGTCQAEPVGRGSGRAMPPGAVDQVGTVLGEERGEAYGVVQGPAAG